MNEKEPNMPVASQVQSRMQMGSRAALFAGFGALLILMAIICVDSLHTLGEFQTANTEIRQDLLYREHTLEQVNISPYTVETHRSHILQKLNLHNPAELILYAVRKGIIS